MASRRNSLPGRDRFPLHTNLLVRDFNQYLVNQLEALLPLNTDLNILHLTSQESTGLQAVDLFCWGVFRKYENNDIEWYQAFCDKVKFETEYLR